MEGFKSDADSSEKSPTNEPVKIFDQSTLSRRLLALNDDADFQRQLCPPLLRLAGHELPAIAIAGAIGLLIDRYTHGDRARPSSQLAILFIPHIVGAMIEAPLQRDAVLRELGMSSKSEG